MAEERWDEIDPRLERALGEVDGGWDPDRTERALRGLHHKRLRRRVTGGVGAAALVAAALLLGVRWVGQPGRSRVASAPARSADAGNVLPTPAPSGVDLGDGATVYPAADAVIEVAQVSPDQVDVQVVSGQGRFEVGADYPRRMVVHATGVQITVHATEFTVASERDIAEVAVEQGHVEVLWDGALDTVGAGQRRQFGPAGETDTEQPPSAAEVRPGPAEPRHRDDWRALARDGKVEAALALLRGGVEVDDRVGDLLLAADVFRIGGDPTAAVKPLGAIVSHHASDPRAPLAAFTLGRVLLDDLGRPVAAAEAFARAREFAPDGALAEDALAREVEAWSKAGQATTARQRAQEYLDRYPRGHRVRTVKQYGHL